MTQTYSIVQWSSRRADAKATVLGSFPLRARAGELSFIEGLNTILEALADNPSEPRWLSIGSYYDGPHTLAGWKDSNCIVLEYQEDAAEGLDRRLREMGLYAIHMLATDCGQDKQVRNVVILPLDARVGDSKDHARLSSLIIHELRQVGLTGGEACTYFLHAPPVHDPAVEYDSEALLSIDGLADNTRTANAQWRAA